MRCRQVQGERRERRIQSSDLSECKPGHIFSHATHVSTRVRERKETVIVGKSHLMTLSLVKASERRSTTPFFIA
jgi:hypothetical protein